MNFKNIPQVKLGIVAVSRDCFPMELSAGRRQAVVGAYKEVYGDIYECPTTVESEVHMRKALSEVREYPKRDGNLQHVCMYSLPESIK